ncbi:hypothetical protein HBI32_250790 [Parastagonospora nodorum]|nr:hypothetical protein HBI32_250790 [Parastagonospora nodorum]
MLFLTSYATEKVYICAADSLSSTIIVYNHIKKDKNADLAIANSISDAPDMCAKDNLIRRKSLLQLAEKLATAESITAKELLIARGNNILSLIAFIISHCLFADELVYALNRATVVLIIILVNKTQLSLISGDVAAYTLLAKFIPTTKIRNPLLKKNAAKSKILLVCADRRTRQCYLTIYAILKHYNFNIHVSLATDTLHLLLKGLIMHSTSLKRFNNKRAFTELIAIVSLLFVSKAPFALHFIRVVCNLVTLAQYKRALERINIFKKEFQVYQQTLEEEKNFNYPKALDSICTRANSKAHYITIVKQFYSIINKKETALLAANYATIVKQSQLSTTIDIQDCTYSIRVTRPLPFRRLRYEVAANIAISNFIYAAAQFSSKRHNDSKHCNEELHLILIIIDHTYYDKDRKHIAYIRAFSKVLLFNNNRQINNTTRILSTLQAFKFYNLSTIICLVHLVLRDLPNSTTRTTMSYYVNNYIN